MKKEKKGFTLVELIIVIAIIALLMVVAIPSILLISNKINDRMYNSKVELILAAAEIYADDNFASLFGDGTNKTSIRVKELVPTYLEADEVEKNLQTGEVTYTITDPRDDSSMNDRVIWLTKKNSRVIATLEVDSIDPDTGGGEEEDEGEAGLEQFVNFTDGHVIVVAFLNDIPIPPEPVEVNGVRANLFPKVSVADFNAVKSRCNGGSSLSVSDPDDDYKVSVSNIKKQTICMLYFESKAE